MTDNGRVIDEEVIAVIDLRSSTKGTLLHHSVVCSNLVLSYITLSPHVPMMYPGNVVYESRDFPRAQRN